MLLIGNLVISVTACIGRSGTRRQAEFYPGTGWLDALIGGAIYRNSQGILEATVEGEQTWGMYEAV